MMYQIFIVYCRVIRIIKIYIILCQIYTDGRRKEIEKI
jgi:hypothetical protein